ncbi:hypothetical protein GCM10010174_23780 [Kutzneria viridogrisea]|uniref:Major facilitator superfamily MFS_1 n=2 Tax=Kutzneria TaxID=43356 RepID=W5VXX1_9PSEU|nr:MFS transporter [Kutzneria albida]AHH93713.1 major facilitator superfamily MFS_1 [Kutzneria albida DSM 43870]MBA8931283.1 dTMP kinase [Kutzneria viridogrisea]
MREVLAIPAFRRLWTSAYLCCVGDWLSLLGLSSLLATLTPSAELRSFALSGVVATQLLPGLLLAPLAGWLADRFDRRLVMVLADLVRCGLFLSVAVVGTTSWLLVANFAIGACSMVWIPAKDSSIPTVLHRPEQVEAASQLSLVTTYGLALLTGAGLFSVLSALGPVLGVHDGGLGIASVLVVLNGLLYLSSALILARLPEVSGRFAAPARQPSGMVREGLRYMSRTRLVQGLVVGIVGAIAGAGTVLAVARPYANSLHGGEAAFGTLVIAVFSGLALGVWLAPALARRLPHHRLFGVAILAAGTALLAVAAAPHLWFALAAVGVVGACAGVAFLTGLTIIGSRVEDSVRGRVNAFVQAVVKIVLFGATTLVPAAVTLAGTRTPMLVAGVLAGLAGVWAYRLMSDRHDGLVTEVVTPHDRVG